MEQKLKADHREDTGKGAAHKLRASGRVPAVVYGRGSDPVHVSIDSRELFHALHTAAGGNVLIDLRLDGEHLLTLPREIQRDHLRGLLLHVDFLRIARDEKIHVEVPVHLVGESHGVKEGGVVEHHLWNLQVECLPSDVPTGIEADITALGIGESLKVEDLTPSAKFDILTSPDEVLVSIVTPQILVVEEAEEEELEEGEVAEGAAAEGAEAEGQPTPEGETEG
jgi:large subunit ribosomal protein L25